MHRSFREMGLFPRMNGSQRALVQSQPGPGGRVCSVNMPNVSRLVNVKFSGCSFYVASSCLFL